MAGREYDGRENNQIRNEHKTKGSNKFVLGVLFGGLVGAAAAFLYAPKTGKELRNNVMKKATGVWETSRKRQTEDRNPNSLSIPIPDSDGWESEEGTNYIPIMDSSSDTLKRKLEETKKALEEEEKRINL